MFKMSCKTLSLMFFVSIFVVIPNICLLIYAFENENDECQKGSRGDLTLSDFAKMLSFEKLCLTFVCYVFAFFAREITYFAGFIVCFFDVIFSIMAFIWGIIILATKENYYCVSDGNNMAIATIVCLFFIECSFAYFHVFLALLDAKKTDISSRA